MIKEESSWFVTNLQGLRIDQYLVQKIGRISRQRALKIIESGDFLLDGRPPKKSLRVKIGQKVTFFRIPPDSKNDIKNFEVKIIYENDDMLIVDKPAFLSIHPSSTALYKTLTYWLKVNYPHLKINPCHRLDKETSGVLVCAKTKEFERAIKTKFIKGEIKKTYLAYVKGNFLKNTVKINKPLGLQQNRGLVKIKMVEDHIFGKKAISLARKVFYDEKNDQSLVLIKPKTGRQHQIRAHLSIVGFPIIGDKLYEMGEKFFDQMTKNKSIRYNFRHELYAYKLCFKYKDKVYRFKHFI